MTMNREMEDSKFREFFIEQLKDIYWAEQHLVKGLLKMAKAATSEQLAAAFEKHARETENHVRIDEQIFEALGEEPDTKKCEAMAGLLEEAEELIADTEKESYIRDAGLIMAAQKVEHYEIAAYGTMRVFASYLGNRKVESLLTQILENEKMTDITLTKLAEEVVNEKAAVE